MNPYRSQPPKAFWRSVSGVHFADMTDVPAPLDIRPTDRIATAGSCFAQHIGRNLRERGAGRYMDLEPAPSHLSRADAMEHGFGIYSCRYGNLYTVRQLRQLAQECLGEFEPREVVWESRGRFFDAMRPSVDPVGHADAETVLTLRKLHLAKVREMLETLDLFVFTLGLTEGWVTTDDHTVFASCPGTVAGTFDAAKYRFANFRHGQIVEDFETFYRLLKRINPSARILLTVSPVSLQATASDKHVLVANTYSKATLRAVAGDLADTLPDVMYFPSYELVTNHANRGSFYDPDMRNVNHFGVRHVMDHFFRALPFATDGSVKGDEDNAVICDEERLANEQAA